MNARLRILKFGPAPTPGGWKSNLLGAVHCTLDGRGVEPLLVFRDDSGAISLSSIEVISFGDGVDYDLSAMRRGILLADPRFTPDLRRELVSLVTARMNGWSAN